jgi:hypothetical protein
MFLLYILENLYLFIVNIGFISFYLKVTPHDESPFQGNARRALNFLISPLKFGIHNDKSYIAAATTLTKIIHF